MLALAAFKRASEPAVPALILALQDPSDSVRVSVCRALGAIGPGAKDALPKLMDALADRNPRVREQAAEALRIIGAAPTGSVPSLVAASQDTDPRIRLTAIDLLARTRPVTPEITAALIRSLTGTDSEVRNTAIDGLMPSDDAVSALVSLLKSDDPMTRGRAARRLRTFSTAAKQAIPALIETLRSSVEKEPDDFSWVGWELAEVIAAIGSDATPALLRAARTSNGRVRY